MSTPAPVPAAGPVPRHRPAASGAKMGMWLFLLTEILLFGTLFLVYANYYARYPLEYHVGARELDLALGALNTAFLLTSSLTMALSVSAMRRGEHARAIAWMLGTIAFATLFLVVKAFEWAHKHEVGTWPGSEVLLARPEGEIVFFGTYFLMTGLHALHVLVGIGLIGTVAAMVRARGRDPSRHDPVILVENTGLYWHIVDVIWIFLFPLFYLVGRR